MACAGHGASTLPPGSPDPGRAPCLRTKSQRSLVLLGRPFFPAARPEEGPCRSLPGGKASLRVPATPTPHELKGTACAGTGEPAGRVEAGCPLEGVHLLCEGSAPPPPPPRALNRGTPHPRMALPPPRGQTTPLTALGTLQNPAEGTRTRSPRWVSALGAAETPAGDVARGALALTALGLLKRKHFHHRKPSEEPEVKSVRPAFQKASHQTSNLCTQAKNGLQKSTSR